MTEICELNKVETDIHESHSKLKVELSRIGESKIKDEIRKKIKKKEKEFQKNLGELKPFFFKINN